MTERAEAPAQKEVGDAATQKRHEVADRLVEHDRGDVIGSLFATFGAEPQLTEAVAEGQRRHRDGARITVDRIAELGGLRADVPRAQATALLSAAPAHDGWRELVDGQGLSWDDAEAWLVTALARALLVPEVDAAGSVGD